MTTHIAAGKPDVRDETKEAFRVKNESPEPPVMNYTLTVLFCVFYCVVGGSSAVSADDDVVQKTNPRRSLASGCQKPCHEKPCAEHEAGTVVAIPAVVSLRDANADLVFEDGDGNRGHCVRFKTSFRNAILDVFATCDAEVPADEAFVPRYLHNPGDWLHLNISKCANDFCISLCHSLTYNLLRISTPMSRITVYGTAKFGYTPPGDFRRKMEAENRSPTTETDPAITKSSRDWLNGGPLESRTDLTTFVHIMLSVTTSLTALVFILSIAMLTIILRNRAVL